MQTQVLIIGGGATGTGLARDLAMRGAACVLVEKEDINSGASGANHGLLHSGARYVAGDPSAARECSEEGRLLKRLAPQCIEETGGLFVAVSGDDETYIADFPRLCSQSGIPAVPVSVKDAREMEPALSGELIAAYLVEDAAIDPFKLSLDNIACARELGTRLLRHTRVLGLEMEGRKIRGVRVLDTATGRTESIEAELVVNAAGAWAGEIAAMAGGRVQMRYSKGTLLVTQTRIARRVINRLRPPANGDIMVPGGTVSILGTTSERVDSPDVIYPEVEEVDAIIDQGAAMAPVLATTRYIRAYCGVRPLISSGGGEDDRSASRGFALIDHSRQPEEVENLITISGGKLTTYRLMAEKAADLACERLGVKAACVTMVKPLPDMVDARWTEPGLAPDYWLRQNDPLDVLLCECEMVPRSVVEEIIGQFYGHGAAISLLGGIGLRSRIGKGPCQGTFCSQRVLAELYEGKYLNDTEGIAELRSFLRERWRGQQPLLWNTALAQAELLEAMHCGLFGLDLA
jgi:glycerol-3-phosphate dehydrogenase